MTSLNWYICLFGYASRQSMEIVDTISMTMPTMDSQTMTSIPITTTLLPTMKDIGHVENTISNDDGGDDEDEDDSLVKLKKRRRRRQRFTKRSRSPSSSSSSFQTRTGTANRTVLAITLFPNILRDFMNAGDDEVIATAANQAIKKLKSIDGQFSLINDTPERFNIINIVGPINSREKAREVADEIVRSRGEKPRTVAAHSCAIRECFDFAVDWDRFFSVEAVDHEVEIISSEFGGRTVYQLTKRQRHC